jgi:hypothetical protein
MPATTAIDGYMVVVFELGMFAKILDETRKDRHDLVFLAKSKKLIGATLTKNNLV